MNVVHDLPTTEAADLERAHAAGLAALDARLPGGLPALDGCIATLRQLEGVSLTAQAHVLYQSGALREGQDRDAQVLIAATGTAPRHAWLLRRWLAALRDTGALSEHDGLYRWQHRPLPEPGLEPAALLAQLYAALGFPPAMARLHGATLVNLERLLHDELQIQELLFAGGHGDEALAAYQDNPFSAYGNAAAAELLRQCPARGPALRVVELGGGPGLSTAAALQALAGRRIDYLFSDVSRMFTQAAQRRYAARPGLRYGLLDLNAEFTAQGTDAQSADAVLAGNTLHNAAHIGRSLRHIHRVLAPGGWLVFTESVADNRAVLTSLQFLLSPAPGAMLPGSEDSRADAGTVFIDAPGWFAELRAASFEPQFVLPVDPNSPLTAAGQYLFLAIAR